MKPIFCIVGQTGAGKNYMLDLLLHNEKLLNYGKLYNLVYSTTRAKREGEVNGKDYNFKDNTQYAHESASNCIVESRAYDTINNGRVYYYTTKDEIENINQKFNGIICAASVDQALSYYKKYNNVYFIVIDTPIKVRMNRIINSRINKDDNDTEYLELCRRIVNENEEFNKIWSLINERNSIVVHNNSDIIKYRTKIFKKYFKINLNEVEDIDKFIYEKIRESSL